MTILIVLIIYFSINGILYSKIIKICNDEYSEVVNQIQNELKCSEDVAKMALEIGGAFLLLPFFIVAMIKN